MTILGRLRRGWKPCPPQNAAELRSAWTAGGGCPHVGGGGSAVAGGGACPCGTSRSPFDSLRSLRAGSRLRNWIREANHPAPLKMTIGVGVMCGTLRTVLRAGSRTEVVRSRSPAELRSAGQPGAAVPTWAVVAQPSRARAPAPHHLGWYLEFSGLFVWRSDGFPRTTQYHFS